MKTLTQINIGDRIKYYRERKGMSLKQLADKAGLTPNAIKNWHKTNNAYIQSLDTVSDILGVELVQLFNTKDKTTILNDPDESSVYGINYEQIIKKKDLLIFSLQSDLIKAQDALLKTKDALVECMSKRDNNAS